MSRRPLQHMTDDELQAEYERLDATFNRIRHADNALTCAANSAISAVLVGMPPELLKVVDPQLLSNVLQLSLAGDDLVLRREQVHQERSIRFAAAVMAKAAREVAA